MNLNAFKKKHKLSTADIVETLQAQFPKYTKATESMVEHPEKYGVELSRQAARLLREKYDQPKPKKEKPPKTGRWIPQTFEWRGKVMQSTDEWCGPVYECSVCGTEIIDRWEYCPACGRRMEKS